MFTLTSAAVNIGDRIHFIVDPGAGGNANFDSTALTATITPIAGPSSFTWTATSPGDLLGALTKDAGFAADQIGKINILEFVSFVALDRRIAKEAYAKLSNGNIKGRRFRMRFMSEL